MSTITHNGHLGSSLTESASPRVAICAALALALTVLTMQIIGGAASISQSAQQSAQQSSQQPATASEAAAPLPTVLVVASR